MYFYVYFFVAAEPQFCTCGYAALKTSLRLCRKFKDRKNIVWCNSIQSEIISAVFCCGSAATAFVHAAPQNKDKKRYIMTQFHHIFLSSWKFDVQKSKMKARKLIKIEFILSFCGRTKHFSLILWERDVDAILHHHFLKLFGVVLRFYKSVFLLFCYRRNTVSVPWLLR